MRFRRPFLCERCIYEGEEEDRRFKLGGRKVVAIIGNPNSGKTSLFNHITGTHQRVGNWPGVTVEKKEGEVDFGNFKLVVVDLPGVYSLSSFSVEEEIAVRYLMGGEYDVLIDVVDATSLDRHLYLTVQLLEMGVNLALALNMVDEAEKQGMGIDVAELERVLGVPVVPTVATKGKGVWTLLYRSLVSDRVSPLKVDYGSAEKAIAEVEGVLREGGVEGNLRWMAVSLLESNRVVWREVESRLKPELLGKVREIAERGDFEIEIAERRYRFIDGVLKRVRRGSGRRGGMTDLLDDIVTHRWLGYPVFAVVMYLLFVFTFKLGDVVSGAVERFFDFFGGYCESLLAAHGASPFLQGLIVDGVITGVGAVATFYPYIFLLFTGLSFLEDSGYITRAAFIMDRIMVLFGLQGRSFIPMLLGLGCNVPAVMSTRTIRNRKDRLLSAIVNPFIPCSARLQVLVLFVAAFVPAGMRPFVVLLFVFAGFLVAGLVAKLFSLFSREEGDLFLMELPPYRMPTLRNALALMWCRAKEFGYRATGPILFSSVLLYLISNLPSPERSLAHWLGVALNPLLAPIGVSGVNGVALVFGFFAKETVINSLAILNNVEVSQLRVGLPQIFSLPAAAGFLVFTMLYVPCYATLVVLRREVGESRLFAGAIAVSLAVAWLLAFSVFHLLALFC